MSRAPGRRLRSVSPEAYAMTIADLMDGTAVAARMNEATADRARELRETAGVEACLATVLVGDDPSSATYVRMKQNRCRDRKSVV